MKKIITWQDKSDLLDEMIDDLFSINNEFSMDIIKERVNKYKRTIKDIE